jgi:hypothetical protein
VKECVFAGVVNCEDPISRQVGAIAGSASKEFIVAIEVAAANFR